jgi:RHS repeat-associated protein
MNLGFGMYCAPTKLARAALLGRSFLCGLAFSGLSLACSGACASPASAVIAAAHFEEPLVASGTTSDEENAALLNALTSYTAQTAKDDFAVFDSYLRAYPYSPWRVALLADIGLLDYHYGYFSRALTAWQQSWDAGRSSTDPRVKALVDRVAGELLRMHARLGHAADIERLIADIGDRKLTGQATEALAGAREGLWVFRNNPGIGYLCGPMALKNLLLSLGRPADQVRFLDDYRSGPNGVSLTEVAALAEKAKLDFHLVHREAGQPIPIPSVVHWKVSHYAAIIGEKDGRYHIKDPTFGHDLWVTRGALETETSGFFLALGKPDSGPWRLATADEAAHVHGMGYTSDNDPDDDTPDDPTCDCDGGSSAAGDSAPAESDEGSADSEGMTRYVFSEMLNSLRLQDTPVGYVPPKGPPVPVTITYNQREASQPANFSFFNVSPKWTLNWLAYIQDDPTNAGGNVSRIIGGGGSISESGYNPGTGAFTMEEKTSAVLTRAGGASVSYTLTFADGSTNTYAVSNGATTYPRIVFLSQMADRFGNTLSFTYDSQYRLTAIKDATARSTTFAYGNSNFPLQVTKITDPFKRSATLAYDGTGRLIQITDVLGLVSKYAYDSNSLVDSLTTPYGTTNFSYGDNGNSRYLQATDPLGYTERTEYIQGAPNVPFSDPANTVPTGIIAPFNEYLNDRDTYYWDKHAYAVAAGNYLQARQRHWVHLASNTNITGGVVESIKYPFENRIWFNYPGQPNGGLGTAQSGTLDSPSAMGRVLDDGTTQLTLMQYNALGNVTSRTDPVGRQTTMTYGANNIDLAVVQQKASASGMSTIAQFGNYLKHQPQTYTDAAGQLWKLAYNAAGQITQTTDPLGQTVTYAYNSLGYLLTITNQNGKVSATYTYDTYGRVATLTDSEGWKVAFAYDAWNRVTQETYPDGTTRKFTYKNLDLTSITDRQGRTTSYTYDANRELTSVKDPAGNVTQYGYWENSKLKTLTDGNGNVTNWAIDVQSRPTSKTYADSSVVTMAYEATTSRLKSVTDALSQTKIFAYTVDNRLAGITYQNAVNPTPSVSFTYDPYFPRRASMTDGTGTTSFTYQAPGTPGAMNLAQETGPFNNATVTYQWDALSRLALRRVGGNPETYSYDPIGRISSHASDIGEFALSYLGQTGQITGLQAVGIGTQWTYDTNTNDRRLLTVNSGPNARTFRYTTTAENDITGIAETLGTTTQTWSNSYDAADRLLTATLSTGPTYGYGYDKANNITSFKSGSATTTVGYNALNQVKSFNGKAFTYDANGNLTQDDLHTYQWDAENRLVGIGFIGQSTVSETYQYDGRNHRVLQTVQNGSVSTQTKYFWCDETLCEERNGRDKVIRRYFAEGEEAPAAGTLLFYGRDQLGTVRDVLSASTGSLLATNDYDPYGNSINSSGQTSTDYRYAGLVYDQQSGLSQATYRRYDSRLGRWTNRDPSMESGGVNLYGYVSGNPVYWMDLTGLSGTLTVYSSGTSGLGNHSWISYTPDGGGITTYGTWGNNPTGAGNGLFTNLEQGRPADATRTEHLNDDQEANLMNLINSYRNQGAGAWTYGAPCSTFAANAWNTATGEQLSPYWGPISNPTSLTNSIINANGGVPNATVGGPPPGSSANSSAGSSNSSSSSSANSSTTPSGNSAHASGSF